MPFSGTVAIRAMKDGDYQATIFAGTSAGLVSALAYAGTRGKVICGPGNVTISSTVSVPTGCELILGGGYYTLSGASQFSLGNLATLRGQGRLATVIQADSTFSSSIMVKNTSQDGTQQWCAIHDLQIDGRRSAGATVTRGLHLKAIGQPSVISGVFCTGCSGDGIVIESSSMRIVNTEGNDCAGYNVRLIAGGDVRIDNLSVENIASGKAGLYLDGIAGPASYLSSGFYITGVHVEVIPDNSSQGILISNTKNVSINGVKYFGSGGVGDLIKITGATTDSYGIILQNIDAQIASAANLIVDSTRSYTIANSGDTGTVTLYAVGGQTAAMDSFVVHGPQTYSGAATFKSTISSQGAVSVGLAGSNAALTVGTGGGGNDTATITIDSGSGASGVPKMTLASNSSVKFQAKYSPGATANMFLMASPLFIATTGEVVGARWENSGKLRLGDNTSPTQMLEVAGSILSSALTSGKYPIISTGGLLINGPVPLSGTKVYYVSDSSGGAVTRKLTFTDGILTAET